MVTKVDSKKNRLKRRARVRGKVYGTAQRPRLAVFRSANHIYAQVINDDLGVTLAAASSMDKGFDGYGGNKEGARKVGLAIAEAARRQTSKRSYLTAAALYIMAVWQSWPRAPVKAA